jgi:hypothetical protein
LVRSGVRVGGGGHNRVAVGWVSWTGPRVGLVPRPTLGWEAQRRWRWRRRFELDLELGLGLGLGLDLGLLRGQGSWIITLESEYRPAG